MKIFQAVTEFCSVQKKKKKHEKKIIKGHNLEIIYMGNNQFAGDTLPLPFTHSYTISYKYPKTITELLVVQEGKITK